MKRCIPLCLLLGCIPIAAQATIHKVTSLTAGGSSVILIPGSDTKLITIQNNGSSNVRLSFDGGVAYQVNGGGSGTNPTPTTGYRLAAGTQVTISTGPYTGATPDTTLHKPIVAIMESSTTTLDIVTDGAFDQYPVN